jgi:hypothetical protein
MIGHFDSDEMKEAVGFHAKTEPTTEQERAEVERCWGFVDCHWHDGYNNLVFTVIINSKLISSGHTEAEAIHAAYLYTVEHEKKIAEAQEAVEWIGLACDYSKSHREAWRRISGNVLSRERERLNGLLRGWKG